MIYLVILLLDKLLKISIIELSLYYINNTGVVFGLKIEPLILNAILALGVFLLYLIFKKFKLNNFGLKLVILGCLMNLSDRFIWGGVIDYINIFNILVINLADVIILIGIINIFYKKYLGEKHILKN